MSPAIIYFEETKLQLGMEIARRQIEKFRGVIDIKYCCRWWRVIDSDEGGFESFRNSARRSSGVTIGVGARGQGILTAPPNNFLVVQKTDDRCLVVNHYASQFGAPFPQLLTQLPLKPNFPPLRGPFDPQNISKYIPVSSFSAPFFTCTRGRPPSSSASPRYATGKIALEARAV